MLNRPTFGGHIIIPEPFLSLPQTPADTHADTSRHSTACQGSSEN